MKQNTPHISPDSVKRTFVKTLRTFDTNKVPREDAREEFSNHINHHYDNDETFEACLELAKTEYWVYTDRSMGTNYITITTDCPKVND